MILEDLGSLVTVTLAGSLVMERLVVILKTALPSIFGSPGPRPQEVFRMRGIDPTAKARIFNRRNTDMTIEQWRRIKVLGTVLLASFITAGLAATPQPCWGPEWLCGIVKASPKTEIPWWLYALLISGGSAFWSEILGFLSAAKDLRTAQDRAASPQKAQVIVVHTGEKPQLDGDPAAGEAGVR